MKINEIATLVLAALTLAWTIWTAVWSVREQKMLNRIDGLLRIQETLKSMGLRGLDPNVPEERRDSHQREQLDTVNVAIRRTSAAYVGLVHKAVPTFFAASVLFAYAFVAAIFAVGILQSSPTETQRLANGVAAVIGIGLCIGLSALGIAQCVRARRARAVLKNAGVDLRTPGEKAKEYLNVAGRLASRLRPRTSRDPGDA